MVNLKLNSPRLNVLSSKIIHPNTPDFIFLDNFGSNHPIPVAGKTVYEAARDILIAEAQFNKTGTLETVDYRLATNINYKYNSVQAVYNKYFKQKYSEKTIGSNIKLPGTYIEIKRMDAAGLTHSLPFDEEAKNVSNLDDLLLVYHSINEPNTALEENGKYVLNLYRNKSIIIESYAGTAGLAHNLTIDNFLLDIKNTDAYFFKTMTQKPKIKALYEIYKNFRNNHLTEANPHINIQDIGQGIRSLTTPKIKTPRPKSIKLFSNQQNAITYENYCDDFSAERMVADLSEFINPAFLALKGTFSELTTANKVNFFHKGNWGTVLSENLQFVLCSFESMVQYERLAGRNIIW